MTPQSILIALVAGATSTVLLAAGLTGTLLALPLMILSPLPIAIAGLGWGTMTGFIAAAFTFICLTAVHSAAGGLIFTAIFALPVAYLAHMAGLSRQDDPNEPEEWFPLGAIMLRAIIIGGGVIGFAFVITGFNVEAVTQQALTIFADTLKQLDDPTKQAMEEAIAFHIWFTPYSMPMAWLLIIWLNLSLGIKIAKKSERFNRPSFRLRDVELPMTILPGFGVAILVSLVSPPLSHLGAAFIGIISMALTILGFNTLHVVSTHLSIRAALLGTLYIATFLFGLPAIAVFSIGLADLIFQIRQRYRLAHPD